MDRTGIILVTTEHYFRAVCYEIEKKMKLIFVVLFATLVVLINETYSLPNASDAEIAEIEAARIVKRGLFDCPHNCWGKVGELNKNIFYADQLL